MRHILIIAVVAVFLPVLSCADELSNAQKRAIDVLASIGAAKEICPGAKLNAMEITIMLAVAGIDVSDLIREGEIRIVATTAAFDAENFWRKISEDADACRIAKRLYGPEGTSWPRIIQFRN